MIGRAFTALLVAALAGADGLAAPPAVVTRPAGTYTPFWLTLAGGKAGDLRAFVALRDGKGATAWFLHTPGLGLAPNGAYLVDEVALARRGDVLRGTITARRVSIHAPMKRVSVDVFTLDASVTGGAIKGTWAVTRNGAAESGTLSGSAAAADPVAAAQAWPEFLGPHGNGRGPDAGRVLVADLSAARPVWRAEQPSGSGWGTGTDSRYAFRATVGGNNGGASTPVVAGGRVYAFHFSPAGDPDPAADAKAKAARAAGFPAGGALPVEDAALTDFARARADVVVTCLDAATGATVWRTTFPERTGNIQTHKWRGPNPAPCVAGGVVVAADYTNNYVALRADTGEVAWTHDALGSGTKVAGNQAWSGAFAAGPVVVLQGPSTVGVDPRTGALKWKAAGGSHAVRWSHAGTDRVLVLAAGGKDKPAVVRCLDAATGAELWKQDTDLQFGTVPAVTVVGDVLVGFAPTGEAAGMRPLIRFRGYRLSATGMAKAWEDAPVAMDENPLQAAGDGRVYVGGRESLRCLDAATGKRLAADDAFYETFGSGSNPWLTVAEGRVLVVPEGQHGRQRFALYDADPARFRPLGAAWSPPHNQTTAYGRQPLGAPLVDGRLFVRGLDGLYCYDLRKPAD
ncbi:MAG: hypothetical protein C0501_28020 [Isosphaera sp.]|nr:hypothetical protein [Isosphaera sp.]